MLGSTLYLYGGWNPSDPPHFPAPGFTCSQVWSSVDNGITWTMLTDAPGWSARHMHGHCVYQSKLWVIGGDNNSGAYQTDVWSSTNGTSWTRATADWGIGNRVLHMCVEHNGVMYVMGGQTIPDIVAGPLVEYSDVWSSTDGAAWTKIADGCAWGPRGVIVGGASWRGYIWIVCGGLYPSTSGGQVRTADAEVWRSKDGITWEHVCTSAIPPRQYHCLIVFDDKLFVINGCGPEIVTSNRNDVWCTADGENWQLVNDPVSAVTHASTAWVMGGSLYLACGIANNSAVYKLSVTP